ncbi:MAG: LicD family protein [Mogibacterium sp.]|nr:LicD family protein [Mogibacterium sp.]
MNDTQKILFDLMCEFDEICSENQIEYILAGGATLGAIRNGGFLPWDDDVDILITRDNYLKLDKVLSEKVDHGLENRAWVTEDRYPLYTNPIGRYIDTGTTLISRSMIAMNIPMGINLELFIMDPIPDDPEEELLFRKNLWLYTELRNPCFASVNTKLPVEVTDRDYYETWKRRVEVDGIDACIAELKHELTKYEIGENCHRWCGRWSTAAYIFDDEWVTKRRFLNFEGRPFPFADKVFHHMRENYNSYWDIVPRDSEKLTHDTLNSIDTSYREYEEAIHAIAERNNYDEHLRNRKELIFEQFFKQLEDQKNLCKVTQHFLKKESDKLSEQKWSFDSRKRSAYKASFSNYFEMQFSNYYKRHRLRTELPDDLIDCMIKTLLYSDRMDDAQFFNELYPDAINYEDDKQLIHDIGELKLEKYYGNVNRVLTYLESLKDRSMSDQVEVERAYVWSLSVSEKPSVEQIRRLEERIVNKSDPEIMKYLGDMYLRAGDKQHAYTDYSSVLKQTRNGMIIREIKEAGVTGVDEKGQRPFQWIKKAKSVLGKGLFHDTQKAKAEHSSKAAAMIGEVGPLLDQMNIKWFAGGLVPDDLRKNTVTETPETVIYIPQEEIERVYEALQKMGLPHRQVELSSMQEICYADPETTLINLRNLNEFRTCGMGIKVKPYRVMNDKVHFENIHGIEVDFEAKVLGALKKYTYCGTVVYVPDDMNAFCDILYRTAFGSKVNIYTKSNYLFDDQMSFETFVEDFPDWDEIKQRTQILEGEISIITDRLETERRAINGVLEQIRLVMNK